MYSKIDEWPSPSVWTLLKPPKGRGLNWGFEHMIHEPISLDKAPSFLSGTIPIPIPMFRSTTIVSYPKISSFIT